MARATEIVWSTRREGGDRRPVDTACANALSLDRGPLGALVRPVVYGAPDELLIQLDAIARRVDREPVESFRDSGVVGSIRHLTTLLNHRLTEAE